MSSIPSIVEGQNPMPASADPVELRAAEIAKRNHHTQVTDEDRNQAYEELRRSAPQLPSDEPAAH